MGCLGDEEMLRLRFLLRSIGNRWGVRYWDGVFGSSGLRKLQGTLIVVGVVMAGWRTRELVLFLYNITLLIMFVIVFVITRLRLP